MRPQRESERCVDAPLEDGWAEGRVRARALSGICVATMRVYVCVGVRAQAEKKE